MVPLHVPGFAYLERGGSGSKEGLHNVRPAPPQCSQTTKPSCGLLLMTWLQLPRTISQEEAPGW